MENFENVDYIPEAQINGHANSISPEQIEKALFQMYNSVCKIKKGEILIGTGFLCKIPFPNKFTLFPVLITCNHVLNRDSISPGKIINFTINDEKFNYSILMNSRKAITDEKNDFTIIEIKPEEDNIKFESFLEVDENIFKDNLNDIY